MRQEKYSLSAGGWLEEAKHHKSGHFNQRPKDTPVDLLVLHNIHLPKGDLSSIDPVLDLMLGQLDSGAHPDFKALSKLRVSAHFLIARDGALHQFVSTEDRAWHAGISSFLGKDNCNDYAIGIELHGSDDCPFTKAQYQSLAQLTAAILSRYPAIIPERIVGHSTIAPDRKTDPGPFFDWDYFLGLLQYKQGALLQCKQGALL